MANTERSNGGHGGGDRADLRIEKNTLGSSPYNHCLRRGFCSLQSKNGTERENDRRETHPITVHVPRTLTREHRESGLAEGKKS
jgi:hypothetical protein